MLIAKNQGPQLLLQVARQLIIYAQLQEGVVKLTGRWLRCTSNLKQSREGTPLKELKSSLTHALKKKRN